MQIILQISTCTWPLEIQYNNNDQVKNSDGFAPMMKSSSKPIKTFLLAVLALNILGSWTVTGANCYNDSFQKTIESIEVNVPDYNAPFIGNSFSVQNTDQVFVAAVDTHNNYEYILLNFKNQIVVSLKSLGNNSQNPTFYVTMLRKSNFSHRLSSQDSPTTV